MLDHHALKIPSVLLVLQIVTANHLGISHRVPVMQVTLGKSVKAFVTSILVKMVATVYMTRIHLWAIHVFAIQQSLQVTTVNRKNLKFVLVHGGDSLIVVLVTVTSLVAIAQIVIKRQESVPVKRVIILLLKKLDACLVIATVLVAFPLPVTGRQASVIANQVWED